MRVLPNQVARSHVQRTVPHMHDLEARGIDSVQEGPTSRESSACIAAAVENGALLSGEFPAEAERRRSGGPSA